MNSKKTYIEVVLPLPVEGSFTYSVPENFQEIVKGQRVVVQFGVRKLYTAIILDIHNKKPEGYLSKDIIAELDESNVVNEKQLRFWKWISSYYMSKLGDDGKPIYNEKGKVMKGPNYLEPNLKKFVE